MFPPAGEPEITTKHISFKLKKLLTKPLTWMLKIATLGLVSLDKTLKLFQGPFLFTRNLLFKLIILPNFGRYLRLRSRVSKQTANKRERLILTFTNRYVIHLIIMLIALGVATSNLLAYENRDDYGQNALIYDIIGLENIEIIEDTSTSIEESKVRNYLGENTQLSSDAFTEAQKQEEQIYQEQFRREVAVTEGGAALVKPELASTEAAKITRTSVQRYTVAEGDVIGEIAARFDVTIDTILWTNNLSYNSYIRPGQELVIPPTSGVLHTIKKGDTLKSIAQKYQAAESRIKEFNNIDDDTLLTVGDNLMVPGGRIIYTARPRTYTEVVAAPAYTAPAVASGKMIWPSVCRRITQYYRGWLHTGVDIACGMNNPVRAAADGVVSRVQYIRYGYGYNIVIDHGGGLQTLYAHNSWIYVEPGQQVKQGEIIAKEGSTGRSTGPHLHFEVLVKGSRVNPLSYIR